LNDQQKLVIFSESKETTRYLNEKLSARGFSRILAIDSSNVNDYVDIISENFDANYPAMDRKDDYSIIITTEVLAEGVNLHRANIILNYDIPWNATRLMQRIGRVNRVGTKSKKIYIYNFFPTVQADNDIELNKKAFMKLQGFHSALGEDSQIYTEEEQFNSFGLFERVPEEERDERLIFLSELRKFKQLYPEEFRRIQNMPKRARVGRKDRTRAGATISYLKNNRRDSFYYCFGKDAFSELTFVEAARIFEARVTEKAISLHERHFEHIGFALETFKLEMFVKSLGEKTLVKLGPNETRAIAFASAMLNFEFVNHEEKRLILAGRDAIRVGKFQKLPREVNKLLKKVQEEKINRIDQFHALMKIFANYPLLENIEEPHLQEEILKSDKETGLPEIIISESFNS
jgi:superfamily II DNA or RNA helicase